MDNRERHYEQLVGKRKGCRLCERWRLENPSTIEDGRFDSQHLGPWTWWMGDLHAELLVVGQDFADVKTFGKAQGFPLAGVKTNKSLVAGLHSAGFCEVELPGCRPDSLAETRRQGIFLTNAVLCMKSGGMRAPVSRRCFGTCGEEFLRRTIALIRPRAVVTLGSGGLWALWSALELAGRPPPLGSFCPAGEPWRNAEGTAYFAGFHPSYRAHQVALWDGVRQYLSSH